MVGQVLGGRYEIRSRHSFTNLRVVSDPEASTGYQIEAGSFPGWAEIPTWSR